MKTRTGFVSNSSSSSFIISKSKLTDLQVLQIQNHFEISKHSGFGNPDNYELNNYDEWEITERDGNILGVCAMDNFDMNNFLGSIGVKSKDINWWHS
jgi:hypothetical protein